VVQVPGSRLSDELDGFDAERNTSMNVTRRGLITASSGLLAGATLAGCTRQTPSAVTRTITEREMRQVALANRTGRQPVVFVHGLWLLPSSWDRWAEVFEEAGYAALIPGWPDDPETVDEARANPEVFARKTVGQITDHLDGIIRGLERKPALVGHSLGGLLAEILAGRGLASATVAISPPPFRGVLRPPPLPAVKAVWPVLGNPANRDRAVPLTFDQFRFGFANMVSEGEAKKLYEAFAVPASGAAVFEVAKANFDPSTGARVDTENPGRGPLLMISGEKDNTVPSVLVEAAFKRQQRNPGVTEIRVIPDRGHSLTIDRGWREIADAALGFIRRFA
jgi:pimeloyl-ACP methyl ester carboxylesterase